MSSKALEPGMEHRGRFPALSSGAWGWGQEPVQLGVPEAGGRQLLWPPWCWGARVPSPWHWLSGAQLLPPLHAASSTGRRPVSSLPGLPCPAECHPLSASPVGHWPSPLVSHESALYMEAYVAEQEGGSWQGMQTQHQTIGLKSGLPAA